MYRLSENNGTDCIVITRETQQARDENTQYNPDLDTRKTRSGGYDVIFQDKCLTKFLPCVKQLTRRIPLEIDAFPSQYNTMPNQDQE